MRMCLAASSRVISRVAVYVCVLLRDVDVCVVILLGASESNIM